jgi:hypothetical protein
MVLPRADLPGDSFANLKVETGDVICVCALAPFALMNARTLSKRLRAKFPRHRILVGLWSRSGEVEDFEQRLAKAFDVQVATTLGGALELLLAEGGKEPEIAPLARPVEAVR